MNWSTGKIEAAVAPMKADAIVRAEQEANATVERVRTELASFGQDLKKCAPYPQSNSNDYFRMKYRYQLFTSICKTRQGSFRVNEPQLADVDPGRVAKFVKDAMQAAADHYDSFVTKLVRKIGSVNSASITGNHVWSYSFLTVVKLDGTTEVWKTQQIVNVSKLGLLFNQWPSRKVKR